MALPWKTVWITGASTGIGRQLALDLAGQGAQVAVTARRADVLGELSRRVQGIRPFAADVTDSEGIGRAYAAIQAEMGDPDLVILNAGVWDPMGAGDYGAARALASMSVNYAGLTHAIERVVPRMIERGSGHIAIVASVAGYRGLPKAAAYAPSKAAAISLAEVLHLDLARHGVMVSVVNPGFVETPMTAVNRFPMPFIVGVEEASGRIIRGLEKRKFEVAFPWQMVALLKIARVLPYPAYFWLVRNVIARQAADETHPPST